MAVSNVPIWTFCIACFSAKMACVALLVGERGYVESIKRKDKSINIAMAWTVPAN